MTAAPSAMAPPAADSPAPPAAAIRTIGLRKVYPLPAARGGGRRGGATRAGATPTRGAAPDATAAPRAIPGDAPASGVVALEALDLEIGAGEFFGLLGPNGAGKTTTLGILTTRVVPTGGQAIVAGVDVKRDPVGVKRRIGVVPQRPNPDRSLSVRENLLFHASYFGVPGALARERAQQLLERFELAERADSRTDPLSGGQRQRLMVARALIHDPEILFLDEPTGGLDPQARLALWDSLRELHAQGRTIVLTTHHMEEADRLCQRVAIIDRGRLLALDTPEALKARAPGGTLVELTLDGPAGALTDTARALAGVLRAEALGDVLRVYAPRAGELVSPLFRAVESAGRAVLNVQLSPPSLETLFISLTGRKLD